MNKTELLQKINDSLSEDVDYTLELVLNDIFLFDIKSIPINNIEGFSSRTKKCLMNKGINTIGGLCGKTELQLSSIKGFGSGCFNEVIKVLGALGLQLKEYTN